MYHRLLALVAFLPLACGSGPKRTGQLAQLADSLLPREAPQACLHVSPQTGVPYRTGYWQCTSDPDSAIALDMTEDGEVTSIRVRMPSPSPTQLIEQQRRLTNKYGAPDSPCPSSFRWRTPTLEIDLTNNPTSRAIVLSYMENAHYSMEYACP